MLASHPTLHFVTVTAAPLVSCFTRATVPFFCDSTKLLTVWDTCTWSSLGQCRKLGQCLICHGCVYQRPWCYTWDVLASYGNSACLDIISFIEHLYSYCLSGLYVLPFLYVLIFYPTFYFIPACRISNETCTSSAASVFCTNIFTCYSMFSTWADIQEDLWFRLAHFYFY